MCRTCGENIEWGQGHTCKIRENVRDDEGNILDKVYCDRCKRLCIRGIDSFVSVVYQFFCLDCYSGLIDRDRKEIDTIDLKILYDMFEKELGSDFESFLCLPDYKEKAKLAIKIRTMSRL